MVSYLLVAVDPGKRVCGISIWGCGPQMSILLLACSIRPKGGLASLPKQTEALWKSCASGDWEGAPAKFVFEVPRYYAKKRVTFRGEDALFSVLDAYRNYGVKTHKHYYPSQWKGNVPKPVHERRIKAALLEEELRVVDRKGTHDMWDAIGIGLFATGRTGRAAVQIH